MAGRCLQPRDVSPPHAGEPPREGYQRPPHVAPVPGGSPEQGVGGDLDDQAREDQILLDLPTLWPGGRRAPLGDVIVCDHRSAWMSVLTRMPQARSAWPRRPAPARRSVGSPCPGAATCRSDLRSSHCPKRSTSQPTRRMRPRPRGRASAASEEPSRTHLVDEALSRNDTPAAVLRRYQDPEAPRRREDLLLLVQPRQRSAHRIGRGLAQQLLRVARCERRDALGEQMIGKLASGERYGIGAAD